MEGYAIYKLVDRSKAQPKTLAYRFKRPDGQMYDIPSDMLEGYGNMLKNYPEKRLIAHEGMLMTQDEIDGIQVRYAGETDELLKAILEEFSQVALALAKEKEISKTRERNNSQFNILGIPHNKHEELTKFFANNFINDNYVYVFTDEQYELMQRYMLIKARYVFLERNNFEDVRLEVKKDLSPKLFGLTKGLNDYYYHGAIDYVYKGAEHCTLGHALRYKHFVRSASTGNEIGLGVKCTDDFLQLPKRYIDIMNSIDHDAVVEFMLVAYMIQTGDMLDVYYAQSHYKGLLKALEYNERLPQDMKRDLINVVEWLCELEMPIPPFIFRMVNSGTVHYDSVKALVKVNSYIEQLENAKFIDEIANSIYKDITNEYDIRDFVLSTSIPEEQKCDRFYMLALSKLVRESYYKYRNKLITLGTSKTQRIHVEPFVDIYPKIDMTEVKSMEVLSMIVGVLGYELHRPNVLVNIPYNDYFMQFLPKIQPNKDYWLEENQYYNITERIIREENYYDEALNDIVLKSFIESKALYGKEATDFHLELAYKVIHQLTAFNTVAQIVETFFERFTKPVVMGFELGNAIDIDVLLRNQLMPKEKHYLELFNPEKLLVTRGFSFVKDTKLEQMLEYVRDNRKEIEEIFYTGNLSDLERCFVVERIVRDYANIKTKDILTRIEKLKEEVVKAKEDLKNTLEKEQAEEENNKVYVNEKIDRKIRYLDQAKEDKLISPSNFAFQVIATLKTSTRCSEKQEAILDKAIDYVEEKLKKKKK